MANSPKLKDIDLRSQIESKKEYQQRLKVAQLQLLLIQRHLFQHKRRVTLLFEGWDASGKGGSIRRIVERLDPRGFVVHPTGAPTSDEKLRHYLHRFWTRLPEPGSIAIFDRSWYGRVLVERVEGFCTKEQWKRAYDEINAFEKMLSDDGVPVVKFFLHVSKEEQFKRFKEREKDPFKAWKLTDDDWRNRERWSEYQEAIEDMLKQTSTKSCPWHLIASEHKWFGRINVIEHVVQQLGDAFGVSLELPDGWRFQKD